VVVLDTTFLIELIEDRGLPGALRAAREIEDGGLRIAGLCRYVHYDRMRDW
jgi:hypothetical protein